MDNIKEIIGENISNLRKKKNYTQQDLANLLVYSDKSVSKWERGDSAPDIEVLVKIAQLFDVDVNYMITKHEYTTSDVKFENQVKTHKAIITSLAVLAVWFIVLIIYLGIKIIDHCNMWIVYIWGLPASFVVILVFNSIWGKAKWLSLILSMLVWTTLLAFFLQIKILTDYIFWPLFLLGIPLQIAAVLWHLLLKMLKKI